MPEPLFPGVRPLAERILASLAAGRVGQPFLLVGPDGSGKEVTALEIARRAQCARPASCAPAALCESCHKVASFQHPDICWIGPAPAALEDPARADEVRAIFEAKIADPFARPDFATSSQILIGNADRPGPLTVRGLLQFLRRQAFQSPWQVAIVADAHRLNTSAANALLKTLEEPPPAALIFLLVPSSAGLPPTILSRCQQFAVTPYPEAELRALLDRLAPDAESAACDLAARLADGNVRKALAALAPEQENLRRWTEQLYTDLEDRRTGRVQAAAEVLHQRGVPGLETSELNLAGRRQQALQVCEMLALLLAETLACRELGADWRPRTVGSASLIRRAAARRPTATLLNDIARVEHAKHQIDGNLNLGLVMAVLLQDLCAHG